MQTPRPLATVLGVFAAHFLATTLAAATAAPATPPNIVVILVDDMGFSDLGSYGGEIPTPHLDRLAAGGLRFSQFYNTGRCCPTRASLLTGLYSHQTGIGNMVNDDGPDFPGYRGRLNDSCVTLAEVLKPAGYFTAVSGKWHVGQAAGVTPWNRGFDRSLNAAAGGFYQPGHPRALLFLNGEALADTDPRLGPAWYSTDLWTTFGLKFIDEARAEKKPFFLYLAHNAPHFPLQASAADIAKFRGRFLAGWDQLRAERYARQKSLGLIDARWSPAPRAAAVKPWADHTPAEQDRFDHLMAAYAACVDRLDQAVGRLVAGLRERDALDNTLILFLSDNGGTAEGGPDGRSEGDPTAPNSAWFSGESWAGLQNTPFRRSKRYNHEGGIATPFIAHWPAGIAARGEWRSQPGHVVDLMPTLLDVAGARYPATHAGRPVLPPEGISLRPAFASPAAPAVARTLFWEHEGHAAVRVGDWKLVRFGRQGAWELYDFASDRTELHDLAAAQPDRASDLAARWKTWAARAHVEPAPGARKPAAKAAVE